MERKTERFIFPPNREDGIDVCLSVLFRSCPEYYTCKKKEDCPDYMPIRVTREELNAYKRL